MEAVYIYFDTATYDEIVRDEKVTSIFEKKKMLIFMYFEGDIGGPTRLDRRHNGPSHWLLHPQWGRDRLLSP